MAKVPKSNKRALILEKKLRRNLIIISLIALFIKVFIIFRIQGFDWYQAGEGDLGRGLGELLDNNYVPPNSWYGADGENYIRGVKGLIEEGFFSTEGKLSFWPAGYPILIWPVAELFKGQFFLVISLLQSILYSFSTIWFVDELRKTRISKSCYVIAILLAFNPTLALNSISIGYEVPIVSMSLISLAALIRYFRTQKRRVFTGEIFVASMSYAIASFMQPRLLLIAAAFFFTWSLARFRLLLISPFLITTIAIVSLAPGLLIFRNEKAQGFSAISTNLGATMRLGAGPGTSGGYSSQASGTVECPEVKGNAAQVDRAIVKCVLSWYVNNPGHAIRLFFNKARFFWSPWYGPEANGTMARNPWNQIHPLKPFTQTESGFELQFGTLGKFVSWLWMLSSLALLALGTLHLWRLGDLERLLGVISVMTFLLSLLTSMLTIGDHRFRLPCMGLILFLQAVGFARLFNKSQRFPVSTSPLVSWPSIRR